jgi:hypothetical protein
MPVRLTRWGGPAAIAGGALFIFKGVVIIVTGRDLDVTSFAVFFFAIGLVGLHARLMGRGGVVGSIGGFLAYIALVASFAAMAYFVFFMWLFPPTTLPGEPEPLVFRVMLTVATFLGILPSLILLGLAAQRAEVMPSPWKSWPLAIGLLWFPLMALGFTVGDGYSLIAVGLAWMGLGYVMWAAKDKLVLTLDPVEQ